MLRAAIGRLGLDRRWMRPALIYAMGSLAAYWSVERIGAVLSAVIYGPTVSDFASSAIS